MLLNIHYHKNKRGVYHGQEREFYDTEEYYKVKKIRYSQQTGGRGLEASHYSTTGLSRVNNSLDGN